MPAGVGILLVGTTELQTKSPHMQEYGRRWVRTEEVGLVAVEMAPVVLTQLLPPFAERAKAIGAESWVAVVNQVVTRGRDVPVSRLQDIARGYLRRASEEQPAATTAEDLPWDEDLFRRAANELVGLSRAA